MVPRRRGPATKYTKPDLRYDVKCGYLEIDGGEGCQLAGGEELDFKFSDSEYADDTALVFSDRASVERMAPKVNTHFRRWGMQVHEKKPTDKKVKTMVFFCAAPPSEYAETQSYLTVLTSVTSRCLMAMLFRLYLEQGILAAW